MTVSAQVPIPSMDFDAIVPTTAFMRPLQVRTTSL